MEKKETTRLPEPLMQLPIIALFLAIAAGSMDGYAYFTTKTFATFQSGNIILSGYTLATGDTSKLIPTLCSILSFGIGAMVLAWIRDTYNQKQKVWTFTILGIEIVILLLLITNELHRLFSPLHIAWILAFLAGMQGNAFHKIDKMLYGNIAVTLNVQLAFNYLAESFFKSNHHKKRFVAKKFFDYFIVLVGFALGAGVTAILVPHIGAYSIFVIIIALAAIYIAGIVLRNRHPKDPIDSN